MKLLWIKTDFLHPTTRGGQIRTLEMLRRLHLRHEVHYVAFEDREHPEAVNRASEYSSHCYPIPHQASPRRSAAFLWQLAKGLFSKCPVAIDRYRSGQMRRQIEKLRGAHRFEWVVCDFLAPAVNIPELAGCVLFQHNVETLIWQRLAEHNSTAARWYLRGQARRMSAFEQRVCNSVRRVVAVSREDAGLMESLFGVPDVVHVPTGVDIEYFTPRESTEKSIDLLFLGSMDWMPNIDAVTYFVREILPLIRSRRPSCSMTIVGRCPTAAVRELAHHDPLITVTGTVPDVRPHMWRCRLMIVPLRSGGGTRLKIYEAMAAKIPVISSTIGAEGLAVSAPENIRLADAPERFAAECVSLLDDAGERERMAEAAWHLVQSRFSWDEVTRQFEQLLGG